MIEGRPFLYEAIGRSVYHINENGVQAIQFWTSRHGIVAFVDADRDDYEPSPILFSPKVQIILATSPKGANRKWKDQVGGIKAIVITPWSRHELFLAGFVLGLLLSTLN